MSTSAIKNEEAAMLDEHPLWYISKEEYQRRIEAYDNGTLEPTKKEGLVINPRIAVEIRDEDVRNFVPIEFLNSNYEEYGDISRQSFKTPVNMLKWDFLYFIDVSVFMPAALAFKESLGGRLKSSKLKGRYTPHPRGTKAEKEFWLEEARRCKRGYEPIVDGKPCGVWIPGEFYFYLNYGVVNQKVENPDNPKKPLNVASFPQFMAMDYYYNKELHYRENPTDYGDDITEMLSILMLKARRMGFSFKAACGMAWFITFNRDINAIVAAFSENDAKECFKKAIAVIDFITEYTPFGLEELPPGWRHSPVSSTNFRYEFKRTVGNETKGRKSGMRVVSLSSKADAIAGEGIGRLYLEEYGKNKNAIKSWEFGRPAMMVGDGMRKGVCIAFGTGGEMVKGSGKKGNSVGFQQMYYNPGAYHMSSYNNDYEFEPTNNKCGMFFAAMWYYPTNSPVVIDGKKYVSVDRNGNPLFWVAEVAINKVRKDAEKTSRETFELKQTQVCKTPSEAFLITKGSRFQLAQLIARDSEIRREPGGYDRLRVPIRLLPKPDGTVEAVVDLKLKPILPNMEENNNREGCVLRYRTPRYLIDKDTGQEYIPDDAYIMSVDTIGANSPTGPSLIAIIVYNTGKYLELGMEGIVATYYGRPLVNPIGYMMELMVMLGKYYNAKITFENDIGATAIINYFSTRGLLKMLLPMPRYVLSTFIKDSQSQKHRYYGHPMSNGQIKAGSEMYLYEWGDKVNHEPIPVDAETGELSIPVSRNNIARLEDEMLIHQLMTYDSEGNYDAVSAFMGIMLQMQERYERPKQLAALNSKKSQIDPLADAYSRIIGINKKIKYDI